MKSAREPVEHVRVCCRVRPLNANEKQMYKDLCVDYPNRTTDVIECRTAAPAIIADGATAEPVSNSSEVDKHSFTFSRVFRPEAGQAEVYDHVAQPIVADVMAGYNGTIFVYGQTGSGKTHTMFGDIKGGAWSVAGEERCSTRSSTLIPAEREGNANEEEEGSAIQNDEGTWMLSKDDPDLDEGNEEAFRPSVVADDGPAVPPPDTNTNTATSSSSVFFCRAQATVTPLGELRQVNSLQTAAGTADLQQKNNASKKTTGTARSSRKFACTHLSKTQERRSRSAFAKDSMSGVIPRAVHDIFQAISDADPSTEFDVQMFFVEVYMEQIRDLLVPSTIPANNDSTTLSCTSSRRLPHRLQLREDVSTNSFYIDGCRMPHVSSANEVLQLVKTGLKYRATSATAMNETSSRSHCLLNLTVKSVNHTQCISTVGKLYLVDLAGSEKVGKTNATGLRLEEAKLINKSLSTLGMVIMSLTDQSATHTPYRNSVLTKILRDSLGGNSHTALVICCSPSLYNAPETLSTLRFGARAKKIENKAVVNRELTATQLKRMLDSAKDEIERLQSKIRQLTGSERYTGGTPVAPYDSHAALTSTSDDNALVVTEDSESASNVPVLVTRKLSNASVASTADASSRISSLLEERASEQARLQQLRAEVAQLQDNLNAAQETITALQEERDGCLDKVQSYQEEVQVWETAHHDAVHRAVTQAALLQQCKVLLHTQSSEIYDLTRTMQNYIRPLEQARVAVLEANSGTGGAMNGSDTAPNQRSHTLITSDATTLPMGHQSESRAGRLSGLSNVPEGESPNPRRQLAAELGDVSIVLPQTSRSQQVQGPHTTEGGVSSKSRLSATPVDFTPAHAAAEEWKSRNPSVGDHENKDEARTHCRQGSVGSLHALTTAQAQCVLQLQEQLTILGEEHATLQQQHKAALAELESKRRILDLRRTRLENIQDELKNEYKVNRELRERLEKEREAVRAPLEMARNDANYWRRRFEELATRRDQLSTRPSENPRSSLRFLFPPTLSSSGANGGSALCGGGGCGADGGSRTIAGLALMSATSKARLSFTNTPSRRTSCRGSGEDVLLSLSSQSTPVDTHEPSPNFALVPTVNPLDGSKATVAFGRGRVGGEEECERGSSPLRPRSASRSTSPSTSSKL